MVAARRLVSRSVTPEWWFVRCIVKTAAFERRASVGKELLERPLRKRFSEALAYAFGLHRKQPRKGTQIPYVAHLLSVAGLALEHGATEDEGIAALLHDAVEDQGGPPTAAAIRQRFGNAVADIVEACTDTDATPKPPWRSRKERYIAHVAGASASVRLVSACDKLHNARAILSDLRALGEPLWGRFNADAGKSGVLWYYRALVGAFRKAPMTGGLRRVVEELDRTVTELEALASKL
jgi:(p)ppGpp synthase/HD superfamily hydrolase